MTPPDHYVVQGDCLAVLKTFPDASISAVVTDPPYGLSKEPDMAEVVRHWCAAEMREHARNLLGRSLSSKESGDALAAVLFPEAVYTHGGSGFMGKTWDSFVPGPEVWREVLRVLKPGGHALVFSGTRTYDLTVLAMRIAGFEIRDQLAWMYATGFPKSLDVSKAIDASDAAAERLARARRFQEWLRGHCTPQQASAATGTDMGHHYTTHPTQPCVATREHFEKLRPFFGEAPAWVEALVDERTVESENMKRREVIGSKTAGIANPDEGARHTIGAGSSVTVDITLPHTPEAAAWSGWGTALKPAQEPIVLARKPLVGTVAANVLAHGTGALNVDGCRIGMADGEKNPTIARYASTAQQGNNGWDHVNRGARFDEAAAESASAGRWPANVIMDEVAAAALDEQSGVMRDGVAVKRNLPEHGAEQSIDLKARTQRGDDVGYGGSGGASRFFYCAKTSRAEREAGLDHLPKRSAGELTDRTDGSDGLKSPRAGAGRTSEGRANTHPTVKPIALMRWLVRLITPPGGIVLDPYCGSGSTLCAAVLEGVTSVGIELTPEYVPIIEGRVAHWKTKAATQLDDALRGVFPDTSDDGGFAQ